MITIVILLILILGICAFGIWSNLTVSTITLEINPSLEIRLNRHNRVTSVVPLNDDAKAVVKGDFWGKDLTTTIKVLTTNIIDSGYVNNDNVPILLYTSGNIDNEIVVNELSQQFETKQFNATITIIETIDQADRELAQKYNINVARAAYINEIIKNNNNLNIESLQNKSIGELRETKETGRYCDKDYALEGDFCVKEINRINATIGNVCPDGYREFDDKCYEEASAIDTDEYWCYRGLTLTSDNECQGIEQIEATPNFTCPNGEPIQRGRLRIPSLREAGNQDEYLCEDRSNAKYPSERCLLQEHAIINGKCAMGPKPLLPTPTGCEGNDINYNGGCYDPNPSEPYICPNGDRYDTNTELCPDTFTYTKASGNYTCPKEYTLNGSKCTRKVSEPASFKKICPSGYTLLDSGQCINKSKTTDYIAGYVCQTEKSRLDGRVCIIYKTIPAKQSNQ